MSTLNDIFGKIVERFDGNKLSDLSATVQFDLGEAQHYLVFDGGNLAHEQGTAESADATITMTSDDFQDLTSGELNPMAAFMSGKIKVKGDMGLVMKLQGVLGG